MASALDDCLHFLSGKQEGGKRILEQSLQFRQHSLCLISLALSPSNIPSKPFHSARRRSKRGDMGRPPCCDKIGVKKGPWTPEEDIILVTYIQEHGPGNWRAVPVKTGLLRCSKSCRLRWTNYLRPGIKRGSFTAQEEKLIIHLQALLGNRWAAIASYLPERTDNDIKNYWNTYLRKKLQKLHLDCGGSSAPMSSQSTSDQTVAKGQWERRLQTDIRMARQALSEALSVEGASFMPDPKKASFCSTSLDGQNPTLTWCQSQSEIPKQASPLSTITYASSTENISRLLKRWMKNGSILSGGAAAHATRSNSDSNTTGRCSGNDSTSGEPTRSIGPPDAHEPLPFDGHAWSTPPKATNPFHDENKPTPISSLERWLFEDGLGHGFDALMDLSLEYSQLF
ncbi:hypothetical protein Taro_044943 [Colocasia esculenta]|uniref:Uncharacterized protein n=1 Tax=Colocasia esculenta TaxID=4460 RepID=A0A843X602_COLES|nr:hypothetical protein [Colocasia esculenta]